MRRVHLAILSILLAGGLPAGVEGQALAEGLWFGSMFPPDVPESFRITYDVTHDNGSFQVIMHVAENDAALNEIRFENGALVFWFDAGSTRVDCVLSPEGPDTYSGECSDQGGETGQLMITRDERRVEGLPTAEELLARLQGDDELE